VAFSILIVLLLLPIAVYVYTSRTIDTVAYTLQDSYQDTTNINTVKSSNYELVDNAIEILGGSPLLGNGADGACAVPSGTISLDTSSCSGRATADAVNFVSTVNTIAGSSSITLSTAPTGLSVGDEVLIVNLQGSFSNYADVGEYETHRIASIDGNTLNFSDGPLVNGFDGTTQKIMVQRVPNYSSVLVSGGATLTTSAWNGTKGGVLFLKSNGTFTVTGSINMNGKGYRGGGNARLGGESFCFYNGGTGGTYASAGLVGTCGGGGGGGGITSASPGCVGYAGGTGGSIGGGGGGGGSNWWEGSTGGTAGAGGGGGYGTFGYGGGGAYAGTNGGANVSGRGGNGYYSGGGTCRSTGYAYGGGGGGGGTYGDSNLTKLYFGSGGAQGGGRYTNSGSGLLGGAGGGIVSVFANVITVSGTIQSHGGIGQSSTAGGSGGGGAGGSMAISSTFISGENLITATGGAGGAAVNNVSQAGGAGGTGRIAFKSVPTYSTNMTLESTDLVPGDNLAVILSFAYSLSALPSGTTASIQFSQDSINWYSSSGVLNAQDTLSVGVLNNIDLEALGWETTSFYYKVIFTSDGNGTPALESIALEFNSAPDAPTIGTPEALSIDTIRWNFTDNADNEDGFMLLDADNNLIKYCLGENLTYCDENGLSENTQYVRKIKAYNELGESDVSSTVQAYTLVSAPTISFGSKSSSMISVQASNIVNNADIYFDCDGDDCDEGINTWITSDNASVTNLENNTGYPFRVKARNGDNVESTYSESLTEYTLAILPEITAGPLSSTSVSLNIDGVNNLASGTSGAYFEGEGEYNEGIHEWVQTDSDVVIGLEPNREYKFRAKVRNYDGVETLYSEYISVNTGASVPSAPVEKEESINTVKIALVKGLNPDSTEYAVLDETTGKYLNRATNQLVENISWGSFAQYGGDSGITISGLSAGIEYKFKVKARNIDNLETEYSPVLSVFTKLLTPTLLSATEIQKTTVNWSVTDSNTSKVGYKIYDQAGNLILTCSYSNMSSCRESNLASNNTYSRKVKVYTNNSESDFSNVFQVTTLAQESGIASLTSDGSDALVLGLTGNSRDTIQILEEISNQYLNKDLKVLTSNVSSLPYGNTIRIEGLKPNTKYTFKVKSINNQGVATNWSSTSSVYTYAQVPAMVRVERVTSEIARLYVNNLENPSNTDIAIKETNSGKFLDFASGDLTDTPVWGKFLDFGGSNGIQVKSLEIGSQYGFAVQAKNASSIETALSESIYIGTSAILTNVNSSLKAVLVDGSDIDLTNPENGQFGEQDVRVSEGEYLLADIPVLFAKDRDWADAILVTSPTENKTVIKLKENHGVSKPFTMYVVGDDTNVFVLCPLATKLADIGPDCESGVKYNGPFPQKINVEGNDVYVSMTVIGGVKYWVADGLTGTGGMGYYEEEEKETGVVLQVFVDLKESIDEIEKPQLQTITVATGAVSVAVGTTAALGGISQFAYSIGQFFLGIFSAFGYKRKRVHYGFVYDSQTKEPIHMAVVRIMNSGNKLVGTEVTNISGRITGNLEPGEYTILVSKRGYEFPSENIKGSEDYPISNIYTGKLTVSPSDSNIQIAIPLDPVEMSQFDSFMVGVRSFFSKLAIFVNFVIFVGGISLSVYMYQKYPELENMLIALVYILPCYTLIASLFDKKGKYGKVLEKGRKPVEGISVFIKEREFNKIVAKRITNEKGQYRFVVDKGRYEISIDSNKYKLLNDIEDMVVDVKKDNQILAKKLKVKEI